MNREQYLNQEQQYRYHRVTPAQAEYLQDFAAFPYALSNGVVRVRPEHEQALLAALAAANELAEQYEKENPNQQCQS